MRQTNKDPELDDKLTDFTDRVLAGKSARPDSSADEELRHLEETIIRLKRALPRSQSDRDALQKIDARLTVRLRKQPKGSMSNSFRRTQPGWKFTHSRPQAALGLLLILLVVLVSTYMIPSVSSGMAATAFISTRPALTAISLFGVVLALIWIARRR